MVPFNPSRRGPFHLAFDAGVKHVVPIVIFGAYELWPTGQALPNAGLMRIHYLDPVSTVGTNLDSLSDRVREAMQKEIERVEKQKLHPKLNASKSQNIGPALFWIGFTIFASVWFYSWYYNSSLFK